MSCYTFLLVSPCGVYSSNGSGAVQLGIHIPTAGSIYLTGKVEAAFLLEKNVNVLLQALYYICASSSPFFIN